MFFWKQYTVCETALMITAFSKRVWAESELEPWRGCSPRLGPRLQTGSLMMILKKKEKAHVQINVYPSCHIFLINLNMGYLLSMMSTTEPSARTKAENSRCVSPLADTPTLWDPSHRNALCTKMMSEDLTETGRGWNTALGVIQATWSGPCCRKMAACRRHHALHPL